ncbi:MAG: hypothetical protein RL341_747 [Pseudomonadota bacterium]|jgi:hypothetical protein
MLPAITAPPASAPRAALRGPAQWLLAGMCVAALIAVQCAVVVYSHTLNPRSHWLAVGVLCASACACMLCLCMPRVRASMTGASVLALAFVLHIIALAGLPVLDDDYFRFLWDGAVLLQGGSPYAAAPADFFLRTDIPVAWQAVLSQINHPDIRTVYGPTLQAVFAAAVFISDAHPFGLHLLFAGAELALIAALLRWGIAPWQVALLGLNPLGLKDIGHALHPDGLLAALLAAAVMLAIARRPLASGVALGLLIAAKLPLASLLLCFAAVRSGGIKLVVTALVTTAVLYAPFMASGAVGLEGLHAFAQDWRVNPLAFTVLQWLLPGQARTAAALCSILLVCVCAVQVHKGTWSLPLALLISLGGALLLAPANNPWYWLLLLPLGLLASHGRRALLITPWVAGSAVLLGYMNGHLFSTLDLAWSMPWAHVHPLARALQAGLIAGAIVFDVARQRAHRTMAAA